MQRNQAVIDTIMTGKIQRGVELKRCHILYEGIEYLTGEKGILTHQLGVACTVLREHFSDQVQAWTPVDKNEFFDRYSKSSEKKKLDEVIAKTVKIIIAEK